MTEFVTYSARSGSCYCTRYHKHAVRNFCSGNVVRYRSARCVSVHSCGYEHVFHSSAELRAEHAACGTLCHRYVFKRYVPYRTYSVYGTEQAAGRSYVYVFNRITSAVERTVETAYRGAVEPVKGYFGIIFRSVKVYVVGKDELSVVISDVAGKIA